MPNGFDEVRFPTNIALGSLGGPLRNTEVVGLASGHEQRNTRWKHSRRSYNAGYGMKHIEDLYQMVAFFEERRGRLNGFRFRDPLDNKSCSPDQLIDSSDQLLGTSDGVQDVFFLTKTYGTGTDPYVRSIRKPVQGSVVVAVGGIEQIADVDFTIDHSTGEIRFFAGHVPASGQEVRAGFAFDVPVRFDTDEISVNLKAFSAGDIPSIPLVEILL